MTLTQYEENCHSGKYSLTYWTGKEFAETFFEFKTKPKTSDQVQLCMVRLNNYISFKYFFLIEGM